MDKPTIEIYSSIECPYAYLAAFRLRQIWPDFEGRVELAWRALSLEYVNCSIYPKPLLDAELNLFAQIEPDLPMRAWLRPEWEFPTTFLPAFEALACAQAQSSRAAFELSWALRHAYFARGSNLALRHELLEIAEQAAGPAGLDAERFRQDWDSGRYKSQVLAESRRGWEDLKLEGSATFVLPDGRRFTNPATGEIDFDEKKYLLHRFVPYPADPRQVYRELLASALS